MLRLNDGIYPVSGKAKDCLYDLKRKRLWQIGKDTAALIRRCITEPDTRFSPAEQAAINKLKDADILTEGKGGIPDITVLRRKPVIRAAWIEVCTGCNLRCIHCYNGEQPQMQMSMQDFREVCETLSASGIQRVQLIGGEPFSHPDIIRMMQTAADAFSSVEIFTNGTLLTEEHCSVMKAHRIRAALSVYSYRDDMHDAVTGIPGSHRKTERAIAMLAAYGIPHRIAPIRMKGIGIGERGGKPYQLTDADIVRTAGRGSLRLLDASLLREKLITRETFRRPPDPEKIIAAVSGHPCFARKIYVTADLTVFPCVMERRILHGTLRGHTLDGIINPAVTGMSKDHVTGCRDCEYRYACSDCRPDSLSGDPAAKPYYCTYDEQRGVWLEPEAFIEALLRQQQ